MQGFSLVELLVVIAIVFVIAATGTSGFFYFKKNVEIDVDVQKIANLIRKAQLKSKAMTNDSPWGIEITSSGVTIFKGTVFAVRQQSFDESVAIKGLVGVSGKTEIVFSKLTGLPTANSIGVLSLYNGINTKNIQINEEGVINY
ncbi:MAG: prepilin-type N-terminal cleavage/methylation domain-containing protein [bacterium]